MTPTPRRSESSSGHGHAKFRAAGDPARAVRFTYEPEAGASVAVGGSPAAHLTAAQVAKELQ